MNQAKAKKAANIEEIRAELQGTMGGSHRHLFDHGDDKEEENEEGEDDVYMYLTDMNLNERANHRAACRAYKASEWNQQQEEGFMRGKRCDPPKPGGPVDNPSTHRILVNFG